MSDYYYNSTKREVEKKRSLLLLLLLLDALMSLLSLVSFVAMIFTLVTSYYDPSRSWLFPLVGLASPAIYVATLLLALYWIIRWRWIFASLLLLPLLFGAPDISHYLKIETSKHYETPLPRGSVKMLSYNVKGFVGDDKKVSIEPINAFIEELRPDVVCFQEFDPKRMKSSTEPSLFAKYNSRVVGGQAIYSRYPILGSSDELINDDKGSGSGFWADLLIGSDTLRLFNIHLHSTAITHHDNEYISNMEFFNDSLGDGVVRSMLSRFKESSIGRASQADSIASHIAQAPHRVAVCGDFNDTPNSYTFRTISRGLQDAFQEAGVGYPYTFRGFMNLLRIDYILVDEPTQVLEFAVVDSVLISDHLPVVTTFKL